MVTIVSLWLPILLASVLVFVVSSIIHMFLTYHQSDFAKLPDEDGIQDALRPFAIPPGDYMLPHGEGMEAMKSEAYQAKVKKGPVALFTVLAPDGVFNMGPSLAMWFAYSVLVGIIAAYMAGRTLDAGAHYLEVFRITGTVAFACYALAHPQRSIWFKQKWSTTLKSMFDGFLYALMTAGAFGWLWP